MMQKIQRLEMMIKDMHSSREIEQVRESPDKDLLSLISKEIRSIKQ